MRFDAFQLFFDLTGPTIAFNRSGSIWVNLRYYLSWHDAQVMAGNLEPALLSNYVSTHLVDVKRGLIQIMIEVYNLLVAIHIMQERN